MSATVPIYVAIIVGAVCLALGLAGSALLRKLKGAEAGDQVSAQVAKVILSLLLVVVGGKARDVIEAILDALSAQQEQPPGVEASSFMRRYKALAQRRGREVDDVEEAAVETVLSLVRGNTRAAQVVKLFLEGEKQRFC